MMYGHLRAFLSRIWVDHDEIKNDPKTYLPRVIGAFKFAEGQRESVIVDLENIIPKASPDELLKFWREVRPWISCDSGTARGILADILNILRN